MNRLVCSCFLIAIYFFFFTDTATTVIYTSSHTRSLHDALPIFQVDSEQAAARAGDEPDVGVGPSRPPLGDDGLVGGRILQAVLGKRHLAALLHGEHRSEEHPSELQSLMRISYAVFCLKKVISL